MFKINQTNGRNHRQPLVKTPPQIVIIQLLPDRAQNLFCLPRCQRIQYFKLLLFRRFINLTQLMIFSNNMEYNNLL